MDHPQYGPQIWTLKMDPKYGPPIIWDDEIMGIHGNAFRTTGKA
jgi:hypothetical protein